MALIATNTYEKNTMHYLNSKGFKLREQERERETVRKNWSQRVCHFIYNSFFFSYPTNKLISHVIFNVCLLSYDVRVCFISNISFEIVCRHSVYYKHTSSTINGLQLEFGGILGVVVFAKHSAKHIRTV